MGKTTIAVALSLITTTTIAQEYEAYATIPGPGPSFHILVSRAVCPEKNAPDGWMKGLFKYRTGDESACWRFVAGKDVTNVEMCPAGYYETTKIRRDYGGTTVIPCIIWPESDFYVIQN